MKLKLFGKKLPDVQLPKISEVGTGLMWMSGLTSSILGGNRDYVPQTTSAWDEEKTDILERAKWLCDKVLCGDPNKLLDAMPNMLGRYYGAEWAIYSCTHLNAALSNISRLYPEEKELCLQRMEKAIDMVLTPEIRAYDTKPWGEDALKTLAGNKSHMTYLSLLSWMITDYKLAGGQDHRFDILLDSCCEALNRRMLKEPDLCLLSFPYCVVFIPDMMFTIVALNNYSKLYNGKYADSVKMWLDKAKLEFRHKRTGLLVAKLRTHNKYYQPMSGAYTALSCYCLTQLDDKDFAKEQYEKMKQVMYLEEKVGPCKVYGIREKLNELSKFSFDPNAGPIIYGLSASGTAWAMGSATYFEDWDFRSKLLHTAEIAGHTLQGKGKRHYRLGEIAPVGEAVVLAMKTNIRH